MRIGRVLEAGATGIMYARCQDAAEAAEVVQWCKFAPLGNRGFCGSNPDMPYCSMDLSKYIQSANEQTFLVIQLEEPMAVENATQIAKVPGVDVLFFGPADYSIAGGIPGNFSHPKIQQAIETIAFAAREAHINWGSISSSPTHSQKLLDLGARLISYLSDTAIFKKQLRQIQRQFESLGFKFDDQFVSSDENYLEME